MSERTHECTCWPAAVAAAILLAAAAAPAHARAGAPQPGVIRPVPPAALPRLEVPRRLEAPRIAHPIDRRNDPLRRRDRRTIAVWPYPWYPDPAPPQSAPDASPPPVIVVSKAASDPPDHPEPAPLPDYSYVPGCHAIPSGYHCDIPRKAP